jgi:ribonuclease Z
MILIACSLALAVAMQVPTTPTQIVFLGTGTPNPDPAHQGPALAIIVNGQPYIVDCGPGLVRQASAARQKGFSDLTMDRLTRGFITHLHSDHTMGLPDLMFTPAITGRKEGLELFGPKGLGSMVKNIEKAWKDDREIRFHGGEPSLQSAYRMTVHETKKDGLIYQDENVKVRAFSVLHGEWPHAYGYRFETPDRVIVISGDTTYSPNLVENARGCDVLIHEVYSAEGLKHRTPDWQHYHSTYHTSATDVGRIANEVKPKLVLLYHELPFGQPPGEILREVQAVYPGDVREAQDLTGY